MDNNTEDNKVDPKKLALIGGSVFMMVISIGSLFFKSAPNKQVNQAIVEQEQKIITIKNDTSVVSKTKGSWLTRRFCTGLQKAWWCPNNSEKQEDLISTPYSGLPTNKNLDSKRERGNTDLTISKSKLSNNNTYTIND